MGAHCRRWSRAGLLAAVALLAACLTACADDAGKPEDKKKPDSGKFLLTIQGTKAGASTFRFDAEGGSEAKNLVTVGGQTQEFTVSVRAKSGKVVGVGADAGPSNHFTATLDRGTARVAINDGAADTQSVPSGAAPFGNFSPHLMSYLLGGYDAKKGGTQPVQLLMIEGLPNGQFMALEGKLAAKPAREVKVGGKALPVLPYTLTIDAGGTQIEMRLFADADRHILAWDVPSQNYTAVREGYEEVLKSLK